MTRYQFSLRSISVLFFIGALLLSVFVFDLPRIVMQEFRPLDENEFTMARSLNSAQGNNGRLQRFDVMLVFYANSPFEVQFRYTKSTALSAMGNRSLRNALGQEEADGRPNGGSTTQKACSPNVDVAIAPKAAHPQRSVTSVPSHSRAIGYRATVECRVTCDNGMIRVYDQRGTLMGEQSVRELPSARLSESTLAELGIGSNGALGTWRLFSSHLPSSASFPSSAGARECGHLEYGVLKIPETRNVNSR